MENNANWWDGLTSRQRLFCEAFAANGGNALQAATEANYSRPDPEGARLLGNARIRKAIDRMREAETESKIATRQERQMFWTSVMRGEDPTADIKERLKASELLGKSQADFLDRVRVEDSTIVIERSYGG